MWMKQQGEFKQDILNSKENLQVEKDLKTLLDILEKNEDEIPSELSTVFRQIRPKVEKGNDVYSVSRYLRDDQYSDIDDDENANLLKEFI